MPGTPSPHPAGSGESLGGPGINCFSRTAASAGEVALHRSMWSAADLLGFVIRSFLVATSSCCCCKRVRKIKHENLAENKESAKLTLPHLMKINFSYTK